VAHWTEWSGDAEVPVAIALTSTALGTLLPILQDSGQLGTRFSDAIMNHGAGGARPGARNGSPAEQPQSRPVADRAGDLRADRGADHAPVGSTTPRHLPAAALIRAGSETTGQTTVRLTVLLLVTLSTWPSFRFGDRAQCVRGWLHAASSAA
jgi:hypothetical protein